MPVFTDHDEFAGEIGVGSLGIASDPGVYMRYVNTKTQIADFLTKGQFTSSQFLHLCRLAQVGPNQGKAKEFIDNKLLPKLESAPQAKKKAQHTQQQ